jgi:hypothetical protein
LGNILVVVEAKYRSGRHDLITGNDDENSGDQLLRQYRSITAPLSERELYAEDVERAIRECNLVQVFVVDARQQRRARREWQESKNLLPPGALLNLVTWQSLFHKLNTEGIASRRWGADLSEYFQFCGLDTFDGISRRLPRIIDCETIYAWHAGSGTDVTHILQAVTLEQQQAAALHSWRRQNGSGGSRWSSFMDCVVLHTTVQSALFCRSIHRR